MKILLDLNKSFSNRYWVDSVELEDYIKYMKNVLWEFHDKAGDVDDNEYERLYDILDMFESFEIKESD